MVCNRGGVTFGAAGAGQRRGKMQVISFMNMKGGVGKTTLAVNVAYGLAALHNKRVLMVDVDPQFNATQCLVQDEAYLKHISDPSKATIKDIFVPQTVTPVRTTMGLGKATNRKNISLTDCTMKIYDGENPPGFARHGQGILDLIPSTLELVEVQHSPRQTEVRLKTFLREKANGYDFVLIDCPPTISIFTESAILASDKYVVPIKPDPLSVLGLPLLERYISDYTTDAGMNLEQLGIVFTQVRRPTPHSMKAVMDDLRSTRKDAVFTAMSSVSTYVSESVEYHKPVFYYKKTTEKVKAQFFDITSEFLKRAGG
jgi:chromosome partitioning protein